MTEETGKCYVCGGWLSSKGHALGETPDGKVKVHTVCKPYVLTAYQLRQPEEPGYD